MAGLFVFTQVLNARANGAQTQKYSEVTDDVSHEILDAVITAEEVNAAIRHLENGKVAGPDAILLLRL